MIHSILAALQILSHFWLEEVRPEDLPIITALPELADTLPQTDEVALAELAVVDALPLGIGILTVENEAQAWIRAHVNDQDRGGDAARAALALSDVKAKLNS